MYVVSSEKVTLCQQSKSQVGSWQTQLDAALHIDPNCHSPGCLQNSKYEERKQQLDFLMDKPEKKERVSKGKDKKEKITDEEKELKKERKLGRKRVCPNSTINAFALFDSKCVCTFRIERKKQCSKPK